MIHRAYRLRTYTLLMLGISVLILLVLSWRMLDRLQVIEKTQVREESAAAQLEFERAVENTLAQISTLAEQITSWDEVTQQFATPTYYSYWRDNRATAQGLWPGYLRGLELYDRQGLLLSTHNSKLPERLPKDQDAQFMALRDGQLCFLRFAEVREPGGDIPTALGSVGLRVDFLSAMRNLHRFAYIDPESLHLKPGYEGVYPASMATELIEYHMRDTTWRSAMPQLVRQTLVQFLLLFAVMMAALYLLVIHLFARPLRVLRDELEAMREHGVGHEAEHEWLPVHELNEVRSALHDYRRSLEQAHDELDQTNARLWREAHIDALTGVFNRRAFEDAWRKLEHCEMDGALALLLIDCDFFKSINDSYGHAAGDAVLKEIAQRIAHELRHDERVYRLGGDEFLVMLWGVHQAQAMSVAERIRQAVRTAPVEPLGIKEPLRVSIGVVASEAPCDELPELLRRVDVAMYEAKRGIGDRKVVLFDEKLGHEQTRWSSRVAYAVMEAAASGQGLSMHYQPVVSSESGRIAYYEALVRIIDDEGSIEPDEIFLIAQRRQLATPLDLAILKSVLADLASGLIPEGTGVAINFDGASIADPEVVRAIDALVPYVGRYKIVLEITETSLISRFEFLNTALARYRELGLRVALDDFGSGYSSLRYLARMPVDIVKLDRSLVEVYNTTPSSTNMVLHVVEMLTDCGFDVVAEGIANEGQQRDFARLGIAYMQGWYFGRATRPPKTPDAG